MTEFVCKICRKQMSDCELYIKHIKIFHKYETEFPCGIIYCTRKYSSMYSLQHHTRKCHADNILFETAKPEANPKLSLSTFCANSPELIDNTSEVKATEINIPIDIEDSIAMFISKLYNNPTITRKAIQDIVESLHELFFDFSKQVKNDLVTIKGLNSKTIESELPTLSCNPLMKFMSEYKRLRYYENSQYLIKPESFYIGELLDDKRIGLDVSLGYKKCEGQIVSMRKTLKHFLELPNVFQTIISYVAEESSNTKSITSVFNANLWKRIKLRFEEKFFLPLFVYFDDYETGNPLGTQAGVHKVGAMYFSVGAIPPKYSSVLENIFLWGLFYSSDRVSHGNKKVFKPFISELKFLEKHGIAININGNQKIIYFVLMFLLGDNLGINSATGMTESFSSNYFCRKCRCSKEVTRTMCIEDQNIFRTPENYILDLNNVAYGIKDVCVWNDLNYFNIVDNVSFDIMHDIFEGICRYEIGRILQNFVKLKHYFTLETLNRRIKYFDYNTTIDIGNRIPMITENHIEKGHIIISCAEMSSLVTYLGFLIGDLIEEDDECWQLYLMLVDIIIIVTKRHTNINELIYLKHLIKEHHEKYISLFNETLKPKHHFILHYPTCIADTGPLCYLSSIRFEAFHKIAKTNAHIVTSRKNIIYTLSLRHQFKTLHRFLSQKGFKEMFDFSSEVTCIQNLSENCEPFNNILKKFDPDSISVTWVKWNGIRYQKNIAIQVDRDNYGEPIFGLLCYIILTPKEDIYFIYRNIHLFGFNKHFQGYLINVETQKVNYKDIHISDTYSVFPAIIHKLVTGDKIISVFNQD